VQHPRAASKAKGFAFAPGEKTLPELSPSWERALLPLQPLLAFQSNLRGKDQQKVTASRKQPGNSAAREGRRLQEEKGYTTGKHW